VKSGVLAPTTLDNWELVTQFQRKSQKMFRNYMSEYFSRVPKRVKMPQGPVIKLCAGDNFTLALMTSGEIFGWGANENGQLKLDSNYLADPTPIKV
jgi:alpha-tubulin suppressor-like RCC1 family protein